MATIPVCLQLYTVRDASAADFYGTLEKVAKIGYAGVELAGLNGKPAAELKKVLDDHNLLVCGAHVGLNDFENKFDETVGTFRTLGAKYLAVPYLDGSLRTSIESYRSLAHKLSEIGAKVNAAGMGFAYHNHDFEFEKFGGDTPGYDVLFDTADAKNVKVEMDAFWVKKAGYDAVAYIHKYAGRVPLVHVKDMTADGKFAPVGVGITDFAAIFAAAESVGGTEYYVVEQDSTYDVAPMDAITTSFKNMKAMGKA